MTDSEKPNPPVTCSADPVLDIGHGVTIEVRRMDGAIAGVAYWHPGKDGARCAGYVSINRPEWWSDGWDLVLADPLTLSPSLLCRACGHHGFIREGKWVPA